MFELIDTLWNVNRQLKSQVRDSNIELIDTLWNVNMYYIEKYMNYQLELIDTLWNVNVFGTQTISSCDSGINRYIMECKCRLDRTITTDWIELIDTLWNVNTYFIIKSCELSFELIDTLWNVNKEFTVFINRFL